MSYTYHRIIRKVVIAFGNLFNEIKLARYDSNGVEQEHFLVPIVYGGKEKYVSRLEGDPDLDKKVQITLPIMSFEMTDMSYDPARKLNTNMKNNSHSGDTGTSLAIYNPVPFDFDFSLWAYVRNIEDGAQLMEKILPYFTPDYTVNVNLVPEMGIVKQLPILLKSVSHEVDYEGDYNSKVRSIIWTLNFTVKGYLYGPVTQPKIIKTAITNIYDDTTMSHNSTTAVMNTGGLGNYQSDETVYQGYSYEMATATGKVSSWYTDSKKLELTGLNGHFVTGTPIKGLITNATWTPSSFTVTPTNLVSIQVQPNPMDVVLPNNYTYSVRTTEFPDSVIYDPITTELEENITTEDGQNLVILIG
jgi:hypothetical protein